MNGIIVLDGPDATGKTTLQKFFKDEYGADTIHLTWNKELAPRMFDYQTEEMLRAIHLSKDNLVIVDRHWISEKIYGKVFRDGSPWPMMGRMMDRIWRKHAALYIITLPPQNADGIAIALKRHHDNLDASHPYPDDKFTFLLKEYSQFYDDNRTRADFMSYVLEFEGRNMKSFCDRALSRLSYLRETQFKPALNPNYQNISGHVAKARLLFVGEQVNRKDNEFAWPFYEYRNSSLFFTTIMDELKVDETRIMMTNAFEEDGTINLFLEPLVLKHGLLPVALGGDALKILRELHLDNAKGIMHPAYVKRFNEQEKYKKQIMEVLTWTRRS